MRSSIVRLSFFLTSALLSTAAVGATGATVISAAEARQHFSKLPQPVAVTSFTSLPPRYEGATIKVAVSVDEDGNVTDVREATRLSPDLQGRILPVVATWKFAPAEDRNGNAVPLRVILPLHLVSEVEDSSSARDPVSAN